MFIQESNFGNELILKCGHVDGIHNSGDHLHQAFEFEFVIDGEIEITVEGKKHIAHRGDIAVIAPFSVHSFYTPSHVKMLICTFTNTLLTDFLPLTELCKRRENYVFHASEPLWRYLTDTEFYTTLKTKKHFDPSVDLYYIHHLKSTFYLILSEYYNRVPEVSKSNIENTLSKILIYISKNYDSNISLRTIGQALGYSPKYVSGLLNTLSEFNLRAFVNSLRVERAKHLLANTDKNNLTIALECGFVSQASFHRAFNNLVGMSPQKYKKKNL